MGDNPFDAGLPQDLIARIDSHQTYQEVQQELKEMMDTYNKSIAAADSASWKKVSDGVHGEIRNYAEELDTLRLQETTPGERRVQDAADDREFAHIRERDELLYLPDQNAYLRGVRALERRPVPEPEPEVEVVVESTVPVEDLTKLRNNRAIRFEKKWRYITLAFFGYMLVGLLSQGHWLGAWPICFFGWMICYRVGVFIEDFSLVGHGRIRSI
jgi:hypothetical protein